MLSRKMMRDKMKSGAKSAGRFKFLPKEHRVVLMIVFVIFTLYAISLLYPLVWILVQSLRTSKDFILHPLDMPKPITFQNYVTVFENYNVFEMFLNSVILTFGSVIATVSASCMAAYVVSRYRFRGRNLIYSVVILVMIIPTTGAMASTYRLMNDSGLAGTHIGIIIKGATAFDFTFLLLYGFFKNLSSAYSESAQIDGAGHFRVFISIMVPLALPSIVAVSIVSFIGHWNDYINPFMYLREHPTLSVGIYLLSSDITSGAGSDYPALFAIMIISLIPVVILFSIFQKTIVENTVAGGIKG